MYIVLLLNCVCCSCVYCVSACIGMSYVVFYICVHMYYVYMSYMYYGLRTCVCVCVCEHVHMCNLL